jgi:hypothetical protein
LLQSSKAEAVPRRRSCSSKSSQAVTADLVVVAAADGSTPPARYSFLFAAGRQCRSNAYIVAAPASVSATEPSLLISSSLRLLMTARRLRAL